MHFLKSYIFYRLFAKKISYLFYNSVKNFFRSDVIIKYKNVSLILPPGHLLPRYQMVHKLYDKFLPFLCSYMGKGELVVDVGANCGDTFALMYNSNPDLSFVCIEPDDYFYSFLKKNIGNLKKNNPDASVFMIKKLVGKEVNGVVLEGKGGTKKAIHSLTEAAMTSETLDALIDDFHNHNFRLLKIDVDGFDWDVIQSGSSVIAKYKPIIFFECYFDYPYQLDEYKSILRRLKLDGYLNFVVFDNFGELILNTSDLKILDQMIDYIWKQNISRTTRTIYYYDFLVYVEQDKQLIEKVLKDYSGEINNFGG